MRKVRTKKDFNNLDGEVADYDSELPTKEIKKRLGEANDFSDCSGLGVVEDYDIYYGTNSVVKNNPLDHETFAPASGGDIGNMEEDEFRSKVYSDLSGVFGKGTIYDEKERQRRLHLKKLKSQSLNAEEKSNLFGNLFGTPAQKAARQANQDTKAQAKLVQAQAAQAAANSLNDNSGTIAQAQALQALAANPIAGSGGSKKMSTGAKVGIAIGIGILALATVVTIVVYKKIYKTKTV
jgi:hypothetical protein